jgi:predicted Zn-dependent protease
MGNTYRAQGKSEDAVLQLSRAFLLASNDQTIGLSAALALREIRRAKDALGVLQRLRSLQPHNPDYEWI